MVETVNTGAGTPDTTAAPEGHDAAMIAKIDEAASKLTTPETEPPAAPEKILGKFDSAEDLAKAYQELEKKLGAPPAPETPPTTETPPEVEDEAAKVVESAGLDMESLSTKYAETGSLEDTDYDALEKAGISRTMVDNYIAGQDALATGMRDDALALVGGEDNFNAIAEWASSNLTAEELGRYNTAVDSGDMSAIKGALEVVNMKYTQAMGTEPKLTLGENGNSSSGSRFDSMAQLTSAMKDPRYDKDPAYRAEVASILSRSSIM